jgi:ElaB/YqjD/DUF883 family membrane-anchored ribosome-binding protein
MEQDVKNAEKAEDAEKTAGHSMHERLQELETHAKDVSKRAAGRAKGAWKSAEGAVRGKPKIGVGIAGAAVLGAAAFVGVGEALLAGAAGWLAYRTLRKRRAKRSAESGANGGAAQPMGQAESAPA